MMKVSWKCCQSKNGRKYREMKIVTLKLWDYEWNGFFINSFLKNKGKFLKNMTTGQLVKVYQFLKFSKY